MKTIASVLVALSGSCRRCGPGKRPRHRRTWYQDFVGAAGPPGPLR